MTDWGYTLFSELNPPSDLVRQAGVAEDAGFAWLAMSDHFHPWRSDHSDSPFAWSVWGAVAERTERVDLVSLVTCPFLRYHPAIIAQSAATIQELSDGRFTLGLGAGERLNEHVVGRGWPAVDIRHEMLEESVLAMRALWDGDWVTYRGDHITVEDARLFSVPATPPRIALAMSGPASLDRAVELADDVVAIDPLPDLVAEFKQRRAEAGSPGGRAIGQVALAWDPDEDRALEQAHRFAFGAHGWKVMAELPNVANFDADGSTVTDDDIQGLVAVGSDPAGVVEVLRPFVEADYDRVCIVQVADRTDDAFFSWWTDEVRPALDDLG